MSLLSAYYDIVQPAPSLLNHSSRFTLPSAENGSSLVLLIHSTVLGEERGKKKREGAG